MTVKSDQVWIKFLIIVCVSLIPQLTARAEKNTGQLDSESASLTRRADLIMLAQVLRIRQTPNDTTVTFQPKSVLKGIFNQTEENLKLNIRSGSVIINPDEPSFSRYEHCVLFLTQNKDGTFSTIDGKIGKKAIINNNVYLDSSQFHLSVKLEDYLKHIQESKEKMGHEKDLKKTV